MEDVPNNEEATTGNRCKEFQQQLKVQTLSNCKNRGMKYCQAPAFWVSSWTQKNCFAFLNFCNSSSKACTSHLNERQCIIRENHWCDDANLEKGKALPGE